MVACSVTGCKNRSGKSCGRKSLPKDKDKKISFHRFPRNPEVRVAWTDALKRKDWTPTKTSVVCSEHFENECFDASPFYRQLKQTAIPTIFSIHYYITPIQPVQDQPGPSSSCTVSASEQNREIEIGEPQIISSAMRHLISKTTPFSPERRLRPYSLSKVALIEDYKSKLFAYKKKIRSIQQKARRYLKQIAILKVVLYELKSKKLYQ